MNQKMHTVWAVNLVAAAVSMAIGVAGILFFRGSLPPQVPLFYSNPWGEAQLTTPLALLMVPFVAGLVGLGLGFLGARLNKHEEVLSYIVWYSSLVIQFLLNLATIRIFLLVT